MLIQSLLNHPQNIRSPQEASLNSHRSLLGGPLAVVRLVLGLAEPSEEGGDGLEGHALAQLLGGVFAGLPLIEGLLFDHVLVVQSVKEHPQQILQREMRQSVHNFSRGTYNAHLTLDFFLLIEAPLQRLFFFINHRLNKTTETYSSYTGLICKASLHSCL